MTALASTKCRQQNTAGVGSESQEQQALFQWWTLAKKKLVPEKEAVMFAVPNGGRRNSVTGARLKAEGVLAGVPDIFLAVPIGHYAGLFIEMKRAGKRTRTSPAQKKVMHALRDLGYACVVCHGWQEAQNAIEAYLLWGSVSDE